MKRSKLISFLSAALAVFLLSAPVNAFADDVVTFNQVNEQASTFLGVAETAYTETNYSETTVMPYLCAEKTDMSDKPLGYTVTVSQNGSITLYDEETGSSWSDSVTKGEYTVYNLVPGHTYTYTLKNSSSTTVNSGQIKATGTLRMIYLPGIDLVGSVYNCRDIGGWECDSGTVKYGLIYRGSQLQRISSKGILTEFVDESDINYLVNACGIQYEIDLRGENESAAVTSSALGNSVGYKRFALEQSTYKSYVDLNGTAYTTTAECLKKVMENVSNGIPTYIHCAAGADRTGTVCFILEALLGVSQEDCDKDYELTCFSSGSDDYTDRLRTSVNWVDLITYFNSFVGDSLQKRVSNWCSEAGIDDELIEAYRTAMINSDASSGDTTDDTDSENSESNDIETVVSVEEENSTPVVYYVFAAYFIIINIAGFALVLYDKRNAKRQKKRVKHNAFITVSALLGGGGTLLAMLLFKNKLNHKTLVWKIAVITLAEYAVAELIIIMITNL